MVKITDDGPILNIPEWQWIPEGRELRIFGCAFGHIKFIEEARDPLWMYPTINWVTHADNKHSFKFEEGVPRREQITALLVALRMSE